MDVTISTPDDTDLVSVLHWAGQLPDATFPSGALGPRTITIQHTRAAVPARNADAPPVRRAQGAQGAEEAEPRITEVARFLAKRVWDLERTGGRCKRSECPICFDEIRTLDEFCLLSCGHEMHKACYNRSDNVCCFCRK
jgi:hypothetical protein